MKPHQGQFHHEEAEVQCALGAVARGQSVWAGG